MTTAPVPPPERQAFRPERALAALSPERIAVDDRSADQLLQRMARVARRLRPAVDGEDAERASPWLQMVARDVSFLLAEMASVDAVEEFLECDRQQGVALREAMRIARTRLRRWRDRACALDASVRGVAEPLERPARTPAGERVEASLLRSIERVLERELPMLDKEPPSSAPDDPVTHDEEAQYFDLNRVTRLLSDLARDYFARSLTEKSDHAAHVGLLLAFVQLLQLAKAQLNGVPERHLDLFYRKVLGLQQQGTTADRGCVVLRLAPTVPRLVLPAGTEFLAEATATSAARRYASTEAVTLTRATVAAVRALYVQRSAAAATDGTGVVAPVERVCALPVADSADGRGAPLEDPAAGWPPFGVDDEFGVQRPHLYIDAGFVIASPVLLMREGHRQVRLTLTMEERAGHDLATVIAEYRRHAEARLSIPMRDTVFSHLLSELLLVSVSGPAGDVAVEAYSLRLSDEAPDALVLDFSRAATDPPLCRPEGEGDAMQARVGAPSVRIRLNPEARVSAYSWFERLRLAHVRIDTTVRGLRSLSLQGAQGPLAPDAPVPVFGLLPERGSFMSFGSDELWHKRLLRMRLHITWANLPRAPESFATHYAAYRLGVASDRFTMRGAVLLDFEWHPLVARPDEHASDGALVPCFPADAESRGEPATQASWEWSLGGMELQGLGSGVAPTLLTAKTADGVFRVELMAPAFAFAHHLYPRLVIDAASRWWPSARRRMRALTQHPPIAPLASRVALDYDATAAFAVASDIGPEGAARAHGEMVREGVWEIGPFGRIRPFRRGSSLVLSLSRRGYLFIGLTGVQAPEPLSLYVQLQETTANGWRDRAFVDDRADGGGRTATPGGELAWRYLSPRGWRPLPAEAIAADETMGLLRSGVIRLELPADFVPVVWGDDQPRGWLELSVDGAPGGYGRILSLQTQAVPLVRVVPEAGARGAEASPPDATDLPAGRITKLALPRPQVAAVRQLAPTAGGGGAEDVAAFRTRVSERLRHGGRAILPADYESLVLDRFPAIEQVRCLTISAGRVMVVVVPRRAMAEAGRPAVTRATCREVAAYLRARTSAFVRDLFVRSPWYETIRVSAWTRFHPGRRSDGLRAVHAAIESFLAPWRADPTVRLGIGTGAFDVSALRAWLDARRDELGIRHLSGLSVAHRFREFDDDLEPTAWVIRDSVTHARGDFEAQTPWSVLVPADEHQLRDEPEPAGIGGFEVGESFAVSPASSGAGADRRRDFEWPRVPAGVGNLKVGRWMVVQKDRGDEHHAPDTSTDP